MIDKSTVEQLRAKGISDDNIVLELSRDNNRLKGMYSDYQKFVGTSKYRNQASTRFLNKLAYGSPDYQPVDRIDSGGQNKKSPGLFARIGETFGNTIERRGTNTAAIFGRHGRGEQGLGSSTLQLTGETFGAVGDLGAAAVTGALKGVGSIASQVTPDFIEEPIKQAGKTVVGGIMQNPMVQQATAGIQQAGEAYGQFKEDNPTVAENIESTANIVLGASELAGAGAIGNKLVNNAKNLPKNVAKGMDDILRKNIDATIKQKAAKIDDIIEKGMAKGVRPTVKGKKGVGELKQYNEKAKSAVKSIVKRKDGLTLTDDVGEVVTEAVPQNLRQFAEAIEDTKKRIYTEYKSLAKAASDADVQIDLSDITAKLDDIANSKIYQTTRPDVAGYAQKASERWKALQTVTPDEADDLIKELNNSLQSFYANGTDKGVAQVDASIAALLRERTDDAIESATKGGYDALKKEYGALRSIEKDVVHRAVIDARKNAKGLADMTDIFTGGELVTGAITMNPAMMTKGAAGMGIKQYIKRLNDPNTWVKKMFKSIDEAINLP